MHIIHSIIFFLIFQNFVMAEDDSDESTFFSNKSHSFNYFLTFSDIQIYWKYSYIVGIIVGCVLITIIFAGSIYIA